jgi:hypothetical protein
VSCLMGSSATPGSKRSRARCGLRATCARKWILGYLPDVSVGKEGHDTVDDFTTHDAAIELEANDPEEGRRALRISLKTDARTTSRAAELPASRPVTVAT